MICRFPECPKTTCAAPQKCIAISGCIIAAQSPAAAPGAKFQRLTTADAVDDKAFEKFAEPVETGLFSKLDAMAAGEPQHPPIYSGVVGDATKPLQEDIDAQRWASEFMQAAKFIWERGEKLDHGLMVGWFANAIMAGFDEQGRRYAKAANDARAEIERMQKLNVETFRMCDAELGRQNFAAVMWAILSFLAGVVATLGTLYGFAIFHR